MAQSSYQLLNLTKNLVLTWPFSFSGGATVADINDVNPVYLTACYAATTSSLGATYNNGASGVGATLTNNGDFAVFSVDGATPSLNARILVKNQTPLSNANGIYTVTTVGNDISVAWVLTRATDYNTPLLINAGGIIPVSNGTVNANTNWIQTTNIINVGISSPNFVSQNGYTIAMPDATLAPVGQNVVFNNISAFSFQIIANDLTTVIATITAGTVVTLYLYDNTTTPASNGLWRVIPYGSGTNAITMLTAQSTDSSITITNGAITPPGGTIDFQLPTSLTNLNTTITSVGFPVITGLSPLTWTTVDFLNDSNISITNSDGTTGNPVFSLASTIGPLTSLTVGNLTISGAVITNSTTNGNVQISTNGTGKFQANGVTIDTSGNLTGINNLTVNGLFSSPFMPKAWCIFTDTSTGLGNTIVVENSANVTSGSVTGSAGTYVITFTTPMDSVNYGVFITLGTTGGSLPFISNGYFITRDTTAVTIVVTDASGALVTAAPNGVTVMIMSN